VGRVRSELDPFLAEARAFEQIMRFCSNSRKAYFPGYYGVITNITRSKYRWPYALRRQAIVLEAVLPDLGSRRVLSAKAPLSDDILVSFSERLKEVCLSPLEISWYQSLFADRFRRVAALHDIGITHGDIRDDHFRVPGDFYDTVLYDFSISYTFSPSWPYLVSFRRPRPLSDIRWREQKVVEDCVLAR
jgi:hypothetical protein